MNRPRSAPPEIPGFTVVRSIGGGGFADVFLYRQQRPNRDVAIKVLRSEHLSEASLAQFANEADVMAEVSAHPYIVTVYLTDVAADGRPFLVMEHYPGEHFGQRARGGQLPVAEALRVGIQVSSAVETAHRAGILHRDIKPANILTSSFGWPGLTDFGLAAVQQADHVSAVDGVTIAFAPPEVLRNDATTGTVASDVYGLAATVYALLAGRSPIWMPGGDNSDSGMLQRGLTGAIPRLSRDDIPPSLANLLANALAADPGQRPRTAQALAQGFQDVEQELRLPRTPIEVRDDATGTAPTSRPSGPDDDRTRRPVKQVNPDGAVVTPVPPQPISSPPPAPPPVPPAASTSAPSAPTAPIIGPPGSVAPPGAARPPTADLDPDTVMRGSTAPTHTGAPGPTRTAGQDPAFAPQPAVGVQEPRSRLPIYLGAAALVLVIIAVAAIAAMSDGTGSAATTTTLVAEDQSEIIDTVIPEPPRDVTATMGPDGTLTVDFVPERDDPDQQYRIVRLDEAGATVLMPDGERSAKAASPPAAIPGFDPAGSVCVEVSTTIGGRISTDSSPKACSTPAAPPAEAPTDPPDDSPPPDGAAP